MKSKVFKVFATIFTMGEETILDVATLSSKFQVTVTKPIRKILGLKAGDRIVFIKKNGEIVIRKA